MPVPVKGGQGNGREVMFAQFAQGGPGAQGGHFGPPQGGQNERYGQGGGQMQFGQGGQSGRPGEQGGRFAQGGPQGGGQMQFGPGGPGGRFAPPQAAGKATATAVKGQPIQGYTNAKGQSCELQAKTTAAEATTTTTAADTASADTSADTAAN